MINKKPSIIYTLILIFGLAGLYYFSPRFRALLILDLDYFSFYNSCIKIQLGESSKNLKKYFYSHVEKDESAYNRVIFYLDKYPEKGCIINFNEQQEIIGIYLGDDK